MENILKDFYYSAKDVAVSDYAKKVLDTIENNKEKNTLFAEIQNLLKKAFEEFLSFSEWVLPAAMIILVLLIYEVMKSSFKAKAIYSALGYCIKLILTTLVLLSVVETVDKVSGYIQETGVFLGVLAPTVGTLLAACGNVSTAKTVSVFMSLLLSVFQFLLYKGVPLVCSVFFGIALTDAASGGGRMMHLSQILKNVCFSVFSIFTSLYIILLGTQSLSASGTDSFSSRAIRLFVGNAVPIVGGTLGEALKLVGGGFVAVKNNVGTAAVMFLILMYIPPLIILWLSGILMNLFIFLCEYFMLNDAKVIFIHVKYTLNFVLAAYTSVFVLGMINIGIFMGCTPIALK